MRKKLLSILLAGTMLTGLLTACGNQQQVSTSTETKGTKETNVSSEVQNSTETQQEEKEMYTIKHVSLNGASTTDHFNQYVKDSAVYKELVKQTSCEIEEFGLDNDQASIRIASGELGDMLKVYGSSNLVTMVENELLLPLNDLIDEYAPGLWETHGEALEFAKNYFGDGNIYFIPILVGRAATASDVVARNLYSVRWDLYKELGYPELKNPDDLVEVLTDMVALEPKTPEGKNVYGASFYVTNTSFFGMSVKFEDTYGFIDVKGHYVFKDMNGEINYSMIDETGPYWRAVEFYNKCYRAGILDPDSFTQQSSDHNAKIESGEILCNIYNGKGYNSKQLANDPETIRGFVEIPVEGTTMYNANCVLPYGTKVTNSIAIPKSSENPERVMEFIAYICSEDGSRMISSGVEGIHWDYVDGVPTYNEAALDMLINGGEEYYKSGIAQEPLMHFRGLAESALHSDGYPINLRTAAEYKSSVNYSPVQQDFCEYYDVSYPAEIFEQYIEEGKIYDLSVHDERLNLGADNEDILRIDSTCMQIAVTAIPKLVGAADDAAFEAVKQDTLKQLKEAGAEEAKAYYVKTWAEAKAALAK